MEELYDTEIAAVKGLMEPMGLINRLLTVNRIVKSLEALCTITRIGEREDLMLEDGLLLY